jgi:hypothetical protein
MKMEQCSETSANKIQTPGNYPEENVQRNYCFLFVDFKKFMYIKFRENALALKFTAVLGTTRCLHELFCKTESSHKTPFSSSFFAQAFTAVRAYTGDFFLNRMESVKDG